MPLSLVRTFRVRHYECDGFGQVSTAGLARYMQEAAFDATAAAGYGLTRYDALDRIWLARETEIKVINPAVYGDTIEVKTWVADFRKVRSIRKYELRRSGSNDLVAQAQTDWAFLEKSTGRPAPIPDDLVTAFFPEGLPDQIPVRNRFPSVPATPGEVIRISHHVKWSDIDPARHINNSAYIALIEDCAMQANQRFGWGHQRFLDMGIRPVLRDIRIEYRQQAVMGDEITLSTWAFKFTPQAYSRFFKIEVRDEVITQSIASFGWANLETQHPILSPDDFAGDCAQNISTP